MKEPIYIITNNNDRSIFDHLVKISEPSQHMQIAVAFLSDDELIQQWIKNGKRLDILVSRQYPTSPQILRSLLHDNSKKVELKWLGPEFHAKVILGCTKTRTAQWVCIGSANLTLSGLESNIEFNVVIRDKEITQATSNWFQQLWNTAAFVNQEELNKYENEYNKVKKSRKTEPSGRNISYDFNPKIISKTITFYKDYWNAVDTIVHVVRNIIRKRFPACRKYPYLAIWGFLYWLKEDCPPEKKRLVKEAVLKGDVLRRNELLRNLFKQYVQESDEENGAHWMKENITKMRRMRRIRKSIEQGRVPPASELLGIIDDGFRNKTKFGRNNKRKVLNSLRYLLQRDGEDVLIRAARLLRDPKYMLVGAKEAAIFGWLGWSQPETYPAMNQKAIDGLKELGFL